MFVPDSKDWKVGATSSNCKILNEFRLDVFAVHCCSVDKMVSSVKGK